MPGSFRLGLCVALLAVASWAQVSLDRVTSVDGATRVDALVRGPIASDGIAIEAYRRGDLDTARSAWSALLDQGGLSDAERGRVLYNLGNVAFRRNQLLEAVGWFSASLRQRPRDGDTWANLEHARSIAKLEPADRGDLTATLHRLLTSMTLREAEWLVLCTALLWVALSIGEALRGGRVWRRLAFTGLALVVVSLTPWIYQQRRAGGDPLLVVQEGELALRSEPRAESAAIANAGSGIEVERIDELPDWTKVRLADGTEGWVEKRAVFTLAR